MGSALQHWPRLATHHPLPRQPLLRRPPPPPAARQVQTNGKKTPIAAVGEALDDLKEEVLDIRMQARGQQGQHAGAGGSMIQHGSLG